MSDKLASLLRKANPRGFHDEVKALLEKGVTPSLEGATFKEQSLIGIDFSDVDLSNTAFEDCTISESRFVGATLDGAFFDAVTLLHCHFEGGSFENFAIDASTLSRCTFQDLNLEESEWTDCRLNDSTLVNIYGESLFWERVTFQGGTWKGIQVTGGDWTHVTLRDLQISDFEGKELEIKNCYYVDTLLVGQWPEGFLEKSGRRKAL